MRYLCEDAGVLLLILPPSSPDLNPVEEFLSGLKSWIRRHSEEAVEGFFEEFLKAAVTANSGGHNAKIYFSHAGVSVV